MKLYVLCPCYILMKNFIIFINDLFRYDYVYIIHVDTLEYLLQKSRGST